ncbi:hypothetical protein BJ138DRAFT_1165706 [Hygrophoropsis aurantiaca]|uniref:Uncharacterized protein n=1 Tax=Hygrophoropsis aurantiaca TaxID=72124 RepID=A0ACB7ZV51_9AGAM|nr:hypothetical protein BJ138DRAFT_1165706 [Hygrophoropsis aurantiaca]
MLVFIAVFRVGVLILVLVAFAFAFTAKLGGPPTDYVTSGMGYAIPTPSPIRILSSQDQADSGDDSEQICLGEINR